MYNNLVALVMHYLPIYSKFFTFILRKRGAYREPNVIKDSECDRSSTHEYEHARRKTGRIVKHNTNNIVETLSETIVTPCLTMVCYREYVSSASSSSPENFQRVIFNSTFMPRQTLAALLHTEFGTYNTEENGITTSQKYRTSNII